MARNKQAPLRMQARYSTITAGNVEYTLGSFPTNDIRIVSAAWTSEVAAASTTANSDALYVATRDTGGTASSTVASWSIGTAAATTITAFVPYALTITGSLSTVTAGKSIQFKMLTIGSGVAQSGNLQIEYILL